MNDLYAVIASHLDLARDDRFHWQPEGTALLKDAKSLVSDTGRPAVGHGAPFIVTHYWRGVNDMRASRILRFLPRFKSFTEIRKSAFINPA